MAMFGKAKEQYEFVKKAREVQKKLRAEIVEGTSGNVTIRMNGEMKVQSVTIDADTIDNVSELEKDVQSAVESATEKAQKVAQGMMKDIMGGMGGGMPF
ncbi:YbaB/EbfC family DNA-binding protein [candidate division WS5 bacterium]|uniref:YbaB/EbfC family DNA-binding protein n=1 Tax=candidate division WS5 bacterium TaxID=2093353 RepID=A0A419DED0_9BACT|nr:MAG: YbaB/EbfC family DNA-binding protein [candidate division WS5 bacterium]